MAYKIIIDSGDVLIYTDYDMLNISAGAETYYGGNTHRRRREEPL